MTTDDIKKHFNETGKQIQQRLGISRQLWHWWKQQGHVPPKWAIRLHQQYGIPL